MCANTWVAGWFRSFHGVGVIADFMPSLFFLSAEKSGADLRRRRDGVG
jgi:hypothetical protein